MDKEKAKIRRMLAMIDRAHREFDLEINIHDSLESIAIDAEECLLDEAEVGYTDICYWSENGMNQHYDYQDGQQTFECDGEIVDFRTCKWYKCTTEPYVYTQVNQQESKEGCYFAVDTIIDTNANKVLLISRK